MTLDEWVEQVPHSIKMIRYGAFRFTLKHYFCRILRGRIVKNF